MMKVKSRTRLAVMLCLAMTSEAASAATSSNNTTIALSGTVNSSLTVGLSGNTQFWDTAHGNPLTPGAASNPGDSVITATTNWTLKPGAGAAVKLYAYFSSATAALTPTSGATNIPSSAFEIKVGAGAFTPVNGTNTGFGVAGSSLLLQSTAITGTNKTGSATANLSFNINLSTLPQIPADTYTGTLNIQAEATP